MPRLMAVVQVGRLHYLDPGDLSPRVGDRVLFPTSTSPEVCEVVWGPEEIDEPVGAPLCAGIATDADVDRDERNRLRRAEIQVAAQRLIRRHELPMKVSAVDWADVGHEAGRPTATVYFTAPAGRLPRAGPRSRARSTARSCSQLGARDDARVQASIGSCGRETCCSTFLKDFEPVTVRMARDQDLPANPMKISGACGRLMCCLKYEHPLYDEFASTAPAVGERVETSEGTARVVAHDVPRDEVVLPARRGRWPVAVPGGRLLRACGVRLRS
jgi:cell fate regulator YaaT (PSP1 superfamily)